MIPLKVIKEISMILVSFRGISERVNVEKVFTVYLKILIRMILNCQVLFGIDINWFRLLGSPVFLLWLMVPIDAPDLGQTFLQIGNCWKTEALCFAS